MGPRREYHARVHVGIDYQAATTHAPGVGRYARELVRALAARGGTHALSLLQVGIGRQTVGDLGLDSPAVSIRRRRLPLPRRVLHAPWFPAADTLLGGVDVFHHVIPGAARVRRARQTVALSEIPPAGTAAAARLSQLLRPMDAVLVFSASGARDATAVLDVPPERVHIVPVGCDHWVRARPPLAHPAEPPTLLVLGAPRAARRPERILEAWDTLRARGLDCRLHFVGGPAPADSPFDQQVLSRPGVTHDLPGEHALPDIVARAAVLVHFNDAEATAVTPLEAFSFGLPVVASDLPAFRETLDGEATLLTPEDLADGTDTLADALATTLASRTDEAARQRRRDLAGRYTWRRNAEATLAVWAGLLG